MKKYIKVTERVCLEKIIQLEVEHPDDDLCSLEPKILSKAFKELPDYNLSGWELVESDGCEFEWVKK